MSLSVLSRALLNSIAFPRRQIEVDDVVLSHNAVRKQHPPTAANPADLERLLVQMNQAGYIPDARFLSHEGRRRFSLFFVLVVVIARDIFMGLVKGLASLAVPHAGLPFSCGWYHAVSRGPNYTSMAGCRFLPSVWYVQALDYNSEKHFPSNPFSDRKSRFSNHSQCWDKSRKVNPRYPDFKHNKTQHGFGVIENLTPLWLTAELASERHLSPGTMSDRKMTRERLWRDFFRDPSQWWDHRSEKVNPRYPDFKHKSTGQSLWLVDRLTPSWVGAELATMAPDLLQSHIFSWHVRLRRHVEVGEYKKTLNIFKQMQREGMMLDKFAFVPVLKACSNLRSLEEGRRVHAQIIQIGCESDVYVRSCLVDMYAKCGSIEGAWNLFDRMQKRDVISWNAMIGGYVKSERGLKALELFGRMQQEGVEPDAVTFVGALNACASVAALELGRRVHEQIIERRYQSDVYVATCLVDMYAKCGSIEDAWSVFNQMQERDVVSWNVMIGGYLKSGQGRKALDLFQEMQQERVDPSTVTFIGVLNACASVMAGEQGRGVHEQIIQRGCESDICVANCLVDMYAKCGSIEDAWSVFNKMRERNVVSWNAMIGGYAKFKQGLKALELFQKMQLDGVEPDALTFVGALSACSSISALQEGRHIHIHIIRRELESDVYVANCLVDMYAKCLSIEDAWTVFNNMRERSVISWNAMIGGYVKSDQGLKALELYRKMQQEGVQPDSITLVGALNACASIGALQEGRCVHEQIIRRQLEADLYVTNCLLDMYAKCGSIEDARSLFNRMPERSVVSWNVMLGAYVKSEQGLKALELFRKMHDEGVEPNTITFVGVLNACASVVDLEEGKRIHEQIILSGCESDVYVATCLVDMYAKCESIDDAWSVFKKMQEIDVVSWSAMIVGYVKSEQGLKALELFQKMQQEGVEPNLVTFVGVLNACASVAALEEGRRVHNQIILRGCECDVHIGTCLIDMYAKCGSIGDAWSVFNRMPEHNVVSWNAMIEGYAIHGRPKKAIELFERMGKEGVEMDEITFICLLTACSHGGLVEEGLRYFNTMTSHYCVCPKWGHYACMVDLLGRAGRLEEAETMADEMMKRLPMERGSSVWMTLLGACRIHRNIEMAERVAKRCWELDPESGSTFVLLVNIYATGGQWDRSAASEQERLKRK